jgi:hypothetical protein
MMPLACAQRHEALLRDCIVSPDVFTSMVDRLRDFVVPYQHAFGTEASQRTCPSLVGLLSHLDCKKAGKIAAVVDVERLVIQAFIGTAPWDHERRERLGSRDTLPENALSTHLSLEPRAAPVCVSNFSASCAAMRVRKRSSRM